MFYKDARNINEFVDGLNRWRKIWNKPALDLRNAADRQTLAGILDAELSPENLTCDGELPRDVVQHRYTGLTQVCRELVKLDPGVKFYEAFEG